MRYMWIGNPDIDPDYIKRCLEDQGSAVVQRAFMSRKSSKWVFITSYLDHQWAINKNLNDPFSYFWSVTSCNKQYVTNEVTGKYLGCMSEVNDFEVLDHVFESDHNWGIRDTLDNKCWIAVKRNPNKLIPTAAEFDKPKPQVRPWPLPAASYEEWRDDIVNRMIKTLDEIL